MVLCFVALFVFAVFGIFSARYRALAREAFNCTLRTITLRPCESGLDEKIKSTIIAKALGYSPFAAKMLNKHYNLISTAFTLLFLASFVYSGISVYNYAAYGNCNGPNSSAFCVFDAVLGNNQGTISLISPGVGPTRGNGSITIVEVGCFSCPYTQKAQPLVKEFLANHREITLEFRAFPIPTHEDSFIAAQAAFCAEEEGQFWNYHDALFADKNHSRNNLLSLARQLNLNLTLFEQCLDSEKSKKRVELDITAGKEAGIYGTPTFFLNNSILVGPTSIEEFEKALSGTLVTSNANNAEVCTQ